jgi:hypothetical protein
MINTGRDIEKYVKRAYRRNGAEWIRKHGNTIFWNMTGNPLELCAGRNILYNSDAIAGNKQYVAHELAHVLDNNTSTYSCSSALCGGGMSEALMWVLGGKPGLLPILDNGPQTLPAAYQIPGNISGGYGNRSTTEYFAEVFSLAIYKPTDIHPDVIFWVNAMIIILSP